MLGLLSGALSVGGSLLSGFGARSSAKKQQDKIRKTYDEINMYRSRAADILESTPHTVDQYTSSMGNVDFQAFVADARAAGFNPLTAIRAGLGAAYARTMSRVQTTEYGHNAAAVAELRSPSYEILGQIQRVPSAGEAIGGAMSTAGNMLNDYSNKLMDQQLQRDLQASYLSGVAARSAASSSAHMMSVPSMITAGDTIKRLGGSMTLAGSPSVGTAAGPKTLNLPFLGETKLSDRSSADDVEQELGDVASSFYGFGRLLESLDLNKQLGRPPTATDWAKLARDSAASAWDQGGNAVTTWWNNWKTHNDIISQQPSSANQTGGGGSW